jgi:hypothetical protein
LPSKTSREKKSAELEQRTTAIIGSGLYSETQARQILRVLGGISDEEWSEIILIVRFPNQARRRINHAIRNYWKARTDEKIDPRARSNVAEAINMASELMARIKSLAHDPNFFKGVFHPHDKSPSEQHQLLADVYTALNQLELLLSGAKLRLRTRPDLPFHASSYRRPWRMLPRSYPANSAVQANGLQRGSTSTGRLSTMPRSPRRGQK